MIVASSPMARWRKPPILALAYISPARSSKRRMSIIDCSHSRAAFFSGSASRRSAGSMLMLARRYSPWKGLPVSEEPAGRAVVAEPRRPQHAGGAILDRARRPGAAHVGAYPARTHRVHQNAVVSQTVRQHARDRVQRGLGDVVGGREIVHRLKRSGLAGDVDDPRRLAVAQQRDRRHGEPPGA